MRAAGLYKAGVAVIILGLIAVLMGVTAPPASAAPAITLTKTADRASAGPGQSVTFTLRYRCASTTENCPNATVVDTMPPNLTIDSFTPSGGQVLSFSRVGQTITWRLGSDGTPGALAAGSTGVISITASFASCTSGGVAPPSPQVNNASFTVDGATTANATASVAFAGPMPSCPVPPPPPPPPPAPMPSLYKRGNNHNAPPGRLTTFEIAVPGPNRSVDDVVPAELHFSWAHSSYPSFDYVSADGSSTSPFPAGSFFLNCGAGFVDWVVLGDGNPMNDLGCSFTIDANGYPRWNATTLRLVSGPMSGSYGFNPWFVVDDAVIPGTTLRNCISEVGSPATQACGEIQALDRFANQTYKYQAKTPSMASPSWTNFAVPGATFGPMDMGFQIVNAHDSTRGSALVDPVIADLLPIELEWVPGHNWWTVVGLYPIYPWTGTPLPAACLNPTFEAIPNFYAGRTLLRWSFPGCTLPGWSFTDPGDIGIAFSARIKATAPAGSYILNQAVMVPGPPLGQNCGTTQGDAAYTPLSGDPFGPYDIRDVDQDGNATEYMCVTGLTRYTLPVRGALEGEKWGQGNLDSERSRFPLRGDTDQSGNTTYDLDVRNAGNTEITALNLIDILPFVSDTTVSWPATARNSEWSQQLSSVMAVERVSAAGVVSTVPSGDYTLGFSTSTNPCRWDGADEIAVGGGVFGGTAPTAPGGCVNPAWTSTQAGARSLAVRLNFTTPLQPAEWVRVRIQATVVGALPLGSVALVWNSFAYNGTWRSGSTTGALLSTEAFKVGMRMSNPFTTASIGDRVWDDRNHDGIQDPGEPGIAGVTVRIYDTGGAQVLDPDGQPRYTITDSLGGWRIDGLAPNTTYSVRLNEPTDHSVGGVLNGFSLTTLDAGSDDASDSDATLVAGYPTISATTGAVNTYTQTFDFGVWEPASIGDRVWLDADNNGAQDGGEAGQPGVTVRLRNADGSLTSYPDQVTNTSGYYRFSNVLAGSYIVEFVSSSFPTGKLLTSQAATGNPATDSDASPVTGSTNAFTLSRGQDRTDIDAGLVDAVPDAAQLSGMVWLETDQDGVRESGETPVAGVSVTLLDGLGNFVSSAVTLVDGTYAFINLVPGTYQVQFNTPLGYARSPRDQGGDDAVDSDADVVTALTTTYVLPANGNQQNVDSGIFALDLGALRSVGNRVWTDTDNDGLEDLTETGVNGVAVSLFQDADRDGVPDGAAIATTSTNAQGYYLFTGVAPGYYVIEVDASNFALSGALRGHISSSGGGSAPALTGAYEPGASTIADRDDNGTDTLSGYLQGAVRSGTIDLVSFAPTGEGSTPLISDTTPDALSDLTIDFGFGPAYSLGNRVFRDMDGDGIFDAGEPIIPGVTVELLDGNTSAVLATTTTDSDGRYHFSGLPRYTYIVRAAIPAGYAPAVYPPTRFDMTVDNDNTGLQVGAYVQTGYDFRSATPPTGEEGVSLDATPDARSNLTLDFGFVRAVSVGNLVYEDLDYDGQHDPGEPGISGAYVILRRDTNGDNVPDLNVAVTTTNPQGHYLFVVAEGTYFVEVWWNALPAYVDSHESTTGDPLHGASGPTEPGRSDAWASDGADHGTTIPGYTYAARSGPVVLVGGTEPLAGIETEGINIPDSTPDDASDYTIDFGIARFVAIGNFVFWDRDNNGTYTGGDTALPNVVVGLYLDDDADGVPDGPVIRTTTTDSSGQYEFRNVVPQRYVVQLEASNFAPGGPYPGYSSSTGVGTSTIAASGPYEPGATGALNDDDNGSNAAGGAIRSRTVDVRNRPLPTTNNIDFTIDFGLIKTITIGNLVFDDFDDDGLFNGADVGIDGVTVRLWDQNSGALVATATTAGGGLYQFTVYSGSTYRAHALLPAGYRSSTDVASSADPANTTDGDDNGYHVTPVETYTNSFTPTTDNLRVDFGLYLRSRNPLSIGNRVFRDNNGNGIDDAGDVGIAGVTVELYNDTNLDSVRDGAAVRTVTTDAQGYYLFTNLAEDYYQVSLPAGQTSLAGLWSHGYQGTTVTESGTYTATDLNDDGLYQAASGEIASSWIPLIGLQPTGEPSHPTPGWTDAATDARSNVTVDFGFTTEAKIGNFVWNDTNGNGIQDSGEAGVANILVRTWQYNATAGWVMTDVTTDSSGYWEIAVVPGNTVWLYARKPDTSWGATPGWQGGDRAVDSNRNGDCCPDVTGGPSMWWYENSFIASAGVDLTHDFGIAKARLGNYVWRDLNRNGVQDPGEPPMVGVRVWVYQNSSGCGGTWSQVGTVLTDASGFYQFDVTPGLCTALEVERPDATWTHPTYQVGSNRAIDSNISFFGGSIPSGQQRFLEFWFWALVGDDMTHDFGMYRNRASIGNFVWEDMNANGIQDPGEPGVAGVDVEYFSCSTGFSSDILTDASGFYRFDDLIPTCHNIGILLPTGWLLSPVNRGTDDTLDSDSYWQCACGPNTSRWWGDLTNLAVEEYNQTRDVGIYRPASVGDRVWNDLNRNGVQDSGETGVNGVTVRLYYRDPATGVPALAATTTTAGDGNYLFTGRIPGTYYVEVDVPSSYVTTFQDAGAATDATDSDVPALIFGGPSVARTTDFTLVSNQNRTDIDAGIFQDARIGDRVWRDSNGDGVQDPGEPGLANVKVILRDGSGAWVWEVLTDTDGYYGFGWLPPGTYSTEVDITTLPPDMRHTYELDSGTGPVFDHKVTVTVAAGEYRFDLDYGYQSLARIGDTLWFDDNADGDIDAGESGVPDVTVTLYNSTLTTVIATTSTDTSGNYLFVVPPGSYRVVVDAADIDFPAGAIQTYEQDGSLNGDTAVTVGEGASRLDIDFGYRWPSSIGDRVWHDVDGDGVQDPLEDGIPNITVILRDSSGTEIDRTTSDSTGLYSFEDLPPGTYTVEIDLADPDLPPLTQETYELDGGSNGAVTIVLRRGEDRDDLDFGFAEPADLGDRVWYDTDGDGVQDPGEPGIENVSVRLYDATHTTLLETRTTNASGFYFFHGLLPGTYVVELDLTDADLPASWVQTFEKDGAVFDGVVSQAIVSGTPIDDVDFGFRSPPATIGDRVWYDTDGDGMQDPGEDGISAVTVTLVDTNGVVVATTTTDSTGVYTFTNVVPGDYRVVIDLSDPDLPAAVVETFEKDGSLDADTPVTVGVGEVVDDVDFGFRSPPASIGDRVWYDTDGDGVQDTGERGLPNLTVTLRDSLGAVVATTTTDASGNYVFEGLVPGTYTVTVDTSDTDLPVSHVNTFDRDGNRDSSVTLSVGPGVDVDDVDFGYRSPPASIGDRVWNDTDGDGVQDPGETGIPNVTVTLRDATGTVIATTTTDASGHYVFDGLAPGTYTVEVDLTDPDLPPNGRVTGDPDSDKNGRHTLTVTPGEQRDDVDFGVQSPTGSIGQVLWVDTNGNGVPDPDEPRLPNVTIELYRDGVLVATVVTDASGQYVFPNLPPGTYEVRVDTSDPDISSELRQTFDPDGMYDGSTTVVLSSGEVVTTANFAYRADEPVPGPDPMPSGALGQAVDDGRPPPSSLAFSGANPRSKLALGALLILAGILTIAYSSWRRRRDAGQH